MYQPDYKAIGLKPPFKVAKMNTGSSSVNYYIKNEDGEFLIKLIECSSKTYKNRLITNLKNAHHGPKFLFEKKLPDYFALVFTWIDGENCYLEKLPTQEFKHLIQSYLDFSDAINANPSQAILPEICLLDLAKKISKPPFFIKKDWNAIQKDLSYHPKKVVIHGDFHYKNIVFKNNVLQSFLDFAEFRYGCPTEDLIRLLITNAEQHNFFRVNYTKKLLIQMLQNTPYSQQDWLYGLDIFVLGKYEKRLKHPSLRHLLMLFRCNFLYRSLRLTINNFFNS